MQAGQIYFKIVGTIDNLPSTEAPPTTGPTPPSGDFEKTCNLIESGQREFYLEVGHYINYSSNKEEVFHCYKDTNGIYHLQLYNVKVGILSNNLNNMKELLEGRCIHYKVSTDDNNNEWKNYRIIGVSEVISNSILCTGTEFSYLADPECKIIESAEKDFTMKVGNAINYPDLKSRRFECKKYYKGGYYISLAPISAGYLSSSYTEMKDLLENSCIFYRVTDNNDGEWKNYFITKVKGVTSTIVSCRGKEYTMQVT